jgi:DNA-3-methyladenine glycosylase I
MNYHDQEWGVPLHDEHKHFEFLLLECMQAGLSWHTILLKRENFRKAFANFEVKKVAAFNNDDIERLMSDPGIIRYRLKIEAAINNGRAFMAVQNEFGSFDAYIWSFTQNKTVVNHWQELKQVPTKTQLSDTISKDMKARGFKFVGSTTIYSHLQAIGIVNDHLVSCFKH